MRKITLSVCQGVGDIFWTYQKFAPYFDAINYRVCHVQGSDHNIQNRAKPFLKLLPKVTGVSVRYVGGTEYEKLAAGSFSLKPIFEQFAKGQTSFDYSCNAPLEEGVRLEAIDPEYPVEENVAIASEPSEIEFPEKKYLTVYVSGAIKNPGVLSLGAWPTNDWLDFIQSFVSKYDLRLPVVLLGASYDRIALEELDQALQKQKCVTTIWIDKPAGQVIDLLQKSLCFIGYQSGLNILADNLDTPQVMLYFKHLEKMQYAWCKNKNREQGVFNAALFDQRPEKVLEGLKLKF